MTEEKGVDARCPVCQWPIADRVEDGCTVGNCSYRARRDARTQSPADAELATPRAQAEADRAEVAEMRVAMARMTPVVEAAVAVVDIGFAGGVEWHDLVTAVAAYRAGTPATKPPRFTAAEAAELLSVAAAVEVLGLERWDAMVAECKEVAK